MNLQFTQKRQQSVLFLKCSQKNSWFALSCFTGGLWSRSFTGFTVVLSLFLFYALLTDPLNMPHNIIVFVHTYNNL